jgi:MFS transporter, DHA3 family, macrolide efflux protein
MRLLSEKNSYRSLLNERDFLFLSLGRLLKIIAMTLFSIEVVWITMYLTNNSALHLSITAMAQTVPFILFGIYGGVLADKWNKKKLMILCDVLAFPILLLIPVLYLFNNLSFLLLVFLTIGFTLLNCLSEPSFRSILPKILPRKKLKQGNALLDSIQRGAQIFVPLSIAFFLLFMPEIHLFTVAAIFTLLTFIAHCFIRYQPIKSVEQDNASDLKAIKETLKYIKTHPEISVPMLGSATCIFINTGLWRVGLPLLLNTQLNADVTAYSYAIGILGFSSLVTSVALGNSKRFNPKGTFIKGVFLWGMGLLMIGMFPHLLVIMFASLLLGIGQAAQGLTRVILFQETLPEHLLGKVFSTSSSLSYASDSSSLLLVPALVAIVPISGLFSGGGAILILLAILARLKLKKVNEPIHYDKKTM